MDKPLKNLTSKTWILIILVISALLAHQVYTRYLRSPLNLIVITVDCARSDRMGFNGYERDTTPYLNQLVKDGAIPVEECVVTMSQVRDADEIWLSNSTKEVVPVIALDGNPVCSGEVGPLWEIAHRLFTDKKFDY